LVIRSRHLFASHGNDFSQEISELIRVVDGIALLLSDYFLIEKVEILPENSHLPLHVINKVSLQELAWIEVSSIAALDVPELSQVFTTSSKYALKHAFGYEIGNLTSNINDSCLFPFLNSLISGGYNTFHHGCQFIFVKCR
jgi:hypothetical protein